MKKEYLFLALIFVFGFLIRLLSVWPSNTIIGFDQARDLFDSLKIIQGHLRIIGPTAGNNPNLHHGVAWLYFMIPPLLLSKNPIYVVLWNSLFNGAAAIVLYFIAKSLFKSRKMGYIAAIVASASYYYVSFSGWLSNPTGTFLTLPLFFLGMIEYYKGKKWGLPLATFFLGLTIEFELFFLYLIPTAIILWFILKSKLPTIKLTLISILTFCIATSTMIATEFKFHFQGVKSILGAGSYVGGGKSSFLIDLLTFIQQKWDTFYLNLWPQNKSIGTLLGILAVGYLIFEIFQNLKKKDIVKNNLFLMVWFFSPAIMFLLGVHNAPWFYIGRPSSAILIAAYILSKIKSKTLIAGALALIIFANIVAIHEAYGKGQTILEPDKAALLSTQISVMEYTYQRSNGHDFAIDTITNPLYINAVWAWNYNWYFERNGYKPTWLGGNQLEPYNTLENATGKEKYFFLIADETNRIPQLYTQNAIDNLNKKGQFIEEKEFDGIKVMMFENK